MTALENSPAQWCPFSRVVGPSGRSTLLLMNAATLKPQPLITFIVIAVHPDAEDVFERIQVEALSKFDARQQARVKLRKDRRDHWIIDSIVSVELRTYRALVAFDDETGGVEVTASSLDEARIKVRRELVRTGSGHLEIRHIGEVRP